MWLLAQRRAIIIGLVLIVFNYLHLEKTASRTFSIDSHIMDSHIIDAKLVVLVITNDNPVYEMNRKVWSLLARERAGIRVYFVVGKPDLPASSPFLVDEDASVLHIRTEESSVPGILKKKRRGFAVAPSESSSQFQVYPSDEHVVNVVLEAINGTLRTFGSHKSHFCWNGRRCTYETQRS